MSNNKSKDLQLMREIKGIRLTEAMEKKKIRPAELLRRAKDQSKSYFNMSPQTLSQIMHGKRSLRYEDAAIFADILGEDTDYLMGGSSSKMKALSDYDKAANKYRMLLNRINADIYSYTLDDNDADLNVLQGYILAYNIESDPIACTTTSNMVKVSKEEMEAFYQDVCRFIRKRFDIMKELGEEV